jgi:delta 1-pyrroline-5-carboxylate dehydrogenase
LQEIRSKKIFAVQGFERHVDVSDIEMHFLDQRHSFGEHPVQFTAQPDARLNNEAVSADDGATFSRVAPLTGKTVTRAAAAGIKESLAAVDSAHAAFKEWSKTGPGQRRALLLKAADEIEARMGDFIAAMGAEVGATPLWAGFNVMLAANLFR